MKKIDRRYLLAGIGILLAIIIFAASLVLFPEWGREIRALIVLAVLAVTAAFSFLANVRQATENNSNSVDPGQGGTEGIRNQSETHVETNGGGFVEGNVSTNGGGFIGGDKNTQQDGFVNIGDVAGDVIIHSEQPQQPSPEDIRAMREEYLNSLFAACDLLSLTGIDPSAASEKEASLELSAVYTALLTRNTEEPEGAERIVRGEAIRRATRPVSALEMLNRHQRLVLLGDPGSGKSTFVSFVFICMAGEILKNPNVNMRLLRQPLPEEIQRAAEKNDAPQLQPWEHGPLMPVRIVLRDLAARGLPKAEDSVGVGTLWRFIEKELKALGLGGFTDHLHKELHDVGGLVMFDGLDEVPEAEKRREQIKQIVEGFSAAFPRCRVLVTSRPYAYQKQEWRLAKFTETTLAPFSDPQIEQFIERWYEQVGKKRSLNPDETRGKAEQLKSAALESERLRGLAERPLLLTLMASLHSWRGGTLPEKREQLYSDAVDLLLNWWEALRVVHGSKGETLQAPTSLSLVQWLKISDRQKVRGLLNRLAFEAHQQQTDRVGTADVPEKDLASGLLDLSEREDVDPHELRDYLSQRAGLLLPRGTGVYTFPHRTFQEYLAACHLTDHDYPDMVADLACKDYERWREVTLLAGAKAARGTTSAIWSLVDALCYEGAKDGPCSEQDRLWGAHLAGQALVESADLKQVSDRNKPKLERVRGWLVQILQQGELTPSERVLAGDNLAHLEDPRFNPELFHLPCEALAGFVEVQEGPFFMGSDSREDPYAHRDEHNIQEINLPTFYLAHYPTTTAQFCDFIKASDYKLSNPKCLHGISNHPVIWVNWPDALAYCEWLDSTLRESQSTPTGLRLLLKNGYRVTLPTEAEWEKGARGGDRRIYPWGSQWHINRANIHAIGIGRISAVGCFPDGASPYEILDMGGNVCEWTRSLSTIYPDILKKGLENLRSKGNRYLCGGSWRLDLSEARCASRIKRDLNDQSGDIGFRICLSRIS